MVRRAPLPPGALPGAIIVFLLAGLGPNVMLAAVALVVLLVGLALLWRPGELPVLLFLFAFPWLQASVAIFHANWFGLTVTELSPFTGDLQTAILLSLAGLLAMAVGMRLGAGAWRWQDAAEASMQARTHWLRSLAAPLPCGLGGQLRGADIRLGRAWTVRSPCWRSRASNGRSTSCWPTGR